MLCEDEVEMERRNQAEQLRRGAAQEIADAEERRLKRLERRTEKEAVPSPSQSETTGLTSG